jgi:hypothetical protein
MAQSNCEHNIQNEINLTLLTKEVGLRYTPIPPRRAPKFAGMLHGKYDALVTINDPPNSRFYRKTILYTPTNDWVENNFTEECLAIVQAIAEETNTVYKIKNSSKTEQGCIPLAQVLTYKVGKDDLQISKMRYIPPRDGKDAMGKVIKNPEVWLGLIQMRPGNAAEYMKLDCSWAMKNTDAPICKFLKEVKTRKDIFVLSLFQTVTTNITRREYHISPKHTWSEIWQDRRHAFPAVCIGQCSIRTVFSWL